MEKIILVGYGGHAKSIADCIERGNKYEIIGYTAPKEQESPYRYLGADDVLWTYCDKGIQNAIVCIGYLGKGDVRDRLYRQLKEIGFRLPIIVDPSAVISKSAHIGEGTFIGKGAVINADAVIGKMAIINTHAVVEHDCKIGDYVHVAVGAVLCGMVNVGDKSLIGANATIIQTIHIGNNCIIGAGSLVNKDLGDGKMLKNHMDRVEYMRDPDQLGGGISLAVNILYCLGHSYRNGACMFLLKEVA